MGDDAFWPALRSYVEANRHQISTTSRLLHTLDNATPIDLAERLFARRFPRVY